VFEYGAMRGVGMPVLLFKEEAATVDIKHFFADVVNLALDAPKMDLDKHFSDTKDRFYSTWRRHELKKTVKTIWEAYGKAASVTPAAAAASLTIRPAQTSQFPDEVGVYEVLKGKLVTIEPEIVNWRTGGVVKNAVTLGLDKGHVNGTVAGPHSKLNVTSVPFGMAGPVEFYIRCLEGNSASEYQLLRFWEKSDRREFRSVTGGVLHASGGAEDNVIAFKFEKIAPRTYKIELPSISMGEYGFLAPGAAASADLASRGKIYTFRIIE
jgi:hypothetical protein